MKNLWYYNQEGIDRDRILQDARACYHNDQRARIIIDMDTEWVYHMPDMFTQVLKGLGCDVHIIYGSFYDIKYNNFHPALDLSKDITHWPTFWFNWSDVLLSNVIDYKNVTYSNFNYPYISMNNKGHHHRCAMIDNLTKNNLLDIGAVTWHNEYNAADTYKFKYFDNRLIKFTDDFEHKKDSFLLSGEFFNSLFHVVGEATVKVPFITEKTVIPILMKKPFVSLGCAGFNRYLKELGFELYDEVIDYSFDTEADMETRAEKMVDSLRFLSSIENNMDVYKKLYPKILHNYDKAQEIIHGLKHIPQIIIDRVNEVKDKPESQSPVDIRYLTFFQKASKPIYK